MIEANRNKSRSRPMAPGSLPERMLVRYEARRRYSDDARKMDEALGEGRERSQCGALHNRQRDKLLQALWHPFNDTLYRQQVAYAMGS